MSLHVLLWARCTFSLGCLGEMRGTIQGFDVPVPITFNNFPDRFVLPCPVDIDKVVLEHIKGDLAYLGGKKLVDAIFDQLL